eukprot:scaffold421315_cov55-Attheya_sp.AAC.1
MVTVPTTTGSYVQLGYRWYCTVGASASANLRMNHNITRHHHHHHRQDRSQDERHDRWSEEGTSDLWGSSCTTVG